MQKGLFNFNVLCDAVWLLVKLFGRRNIAGPLVLLVLFVTLWHCLIPLGVWDIPKRSRSSREASMGLPSPGKDGAKLFMSRELRGIRGARAMVAKQHLLC